MKTLYMVASINDYEYENARFFNNIFEAIEVMNDEFGSVLYRGIETPETTNITYSEVDIFEDREFVRASKFLERQRERKQKTDAALLRFLQKVEELKTETIEF